MIAAFLMFIALTGSVFATVAPTESPTLSPTKFPSFSPTYSLGAELIPCPTQTYGVDTGSQPFESTPADPATNFSGTISNIFIAGRSASTVLVHQSDGPQQVIARFATFFPNSNRLNTVNPPNITWNSSLVYGLVEGATNLTLRAMVYGPKEVAITYVSYTNGADTLKLKFLNTTSLTRIRLLSEVDTGILLSEQASLSRLFTGYYVVAQAASGAFRVRRSIITNSNGVRVTSFVDVPLGPTFKPQPTTTSATTSAVSAIDSRQVIVIVYPGSTTHFYVAMYNTTQFANTVNHRADIPLVVPGSEPRRLAIVTPAAGTFLVVYIDNTAPQQFYTVYTQNTFSTWTTPESIGQVMNPNFDGVGPRISLLWTSNQTVTIFEFSSPRVWTRSWLWNRRNETGPARFNSTFGRWAQSSSLVFTAPTNWSNAGVSGQTSYGYNIFADTNTGTRKVQLSSCMVYTFVNTTRSAGSMMNAGAAAFTLLAASLIAAVY